MIVPIKEGKIMADDDPMQDGDTGFEEENMPREYGDTGLEEDDADAI